MKLFPSRQLVVQYAFPLFLLVAPACLTIITGVNQKAQAQVAPPITPSGLNTHVSGPIAVGGNTQFDITGGTRPGGGANLFHSFGNFSVPTNNIANFLNDSGLATSNILGRVTGGNISNIFGTIQTTGFGNANFFLMNPAGFLFGPNATVNVGGMATFTTADYMRLTDGGRFNANPNAIPADLLTAAPLAAFGFLGSVQQAINFEGGQLTVANGTGITLVGGDINLVPNPISGAPSSITASGRQIQLTSVAGPGEVAADTAMPAPGITGGSINLGPGTLVDARGNAGGTVRIRGGSLVMDNAVISADTINANGAPVAIDINVTGNVSISNVDVPALTARTTGSGNAGEIRISSGSTDVTSTTGENPFFFSAIDIHTSGSGNAGNVTINTGSLNVTGDPSQASFFIDSGTSGPAPGRGGDVNISAQSINLTNTTITTGNFTAFFLDGSGAGTAGNVTLTGDRVQMTTSQIVTDSNDFVDPAGTAGNITITAHDLSFNGTGLSSDGMVRSGAVTITADQLVATETQIQSITTHAAGADVKITGNVIEFREGSNIASTTVGDGNAGSVIITATDHLSFLGSSAGGRPSGIFTTNSQGFGAQGTIGNAGDVFITTPSLQFTGGARINTTTATSGRGGNVTINANSISMSGENSGNEVEPLFNLGTTQSSGIYTRTIGGNCVGPCGHAGNISITAGSLSMGSGAQINSGTTSSGQGGNITVTAGDTIAMSGTLTTGQPGGIQSRTTGSGPDAGAGGNISLTAGQSVTISDHASVSANSTGPGNTGNIQINAGNQFAMTNSSVTTEANAASGGAIKISTNPNGTVQLTNSTISASVLDGTGGGGSVNIDPQFVILLNSEILARAVQGPGGNISITTNFLLPDANSVISASSQFGTNGTVTIQSPNAPISGQIQPLGKTPLIATSLLNQHCAALAGGEFSSFTVAGRDSLPTEPGGWLTSPWALASSGFSAGSVTEGGAQAHVIDPAHETTVLSLRQIAPAGFLTQAFAVDWSTSCQS
jgi:filamentous hemagglutinin family protein